MGVPHAGINSLSTCSMQVMAPQLLHALLSTDLSAVLCVISSSGSYNYTQSSYYLLQQGISRQPSSDHHSTGSICKQQCTQSNLIEEGPMAMLVGHECS